MKLNKNGISIKLLKDVKRGLERLNPKRLGAGYLYNGRCFCALGAAAMHRLTKDAIYNSLEISKLIYSEKDDIYSDDKAYRVWQANDSDRLHETEEQRYTRMYAWVCEELKNV